MSDTQSIHWADINAQKVIREKGEKAQYVCASGITPSGTVHIGNFREIISVDLVVRALREMGKKVRFIYSWDDYDVFRKVPKNMPRQDELATYLRKPITAVPDYVSGLESYARCNEKEVEDLLHIVGIDPDYIYQAKKYKASEYAEQMKIALEKKDQIKALLNKHRTEDLAGDWWPVSVFCTKCEKDTTDIESWDGSYGVSYSCSSCGNKETVDLRKTHAVKLPWRVDWPMRWAFEKVDFEPAGKDHHSEGGSFDTAREVVREIYGSEAPVSFQYDFISIKGRGGKISSSSGEVISLGDVLEVYEPAITRFLFAGTRPNTEFSISFDLDVLKIYEDYDRTERIYYGLEEINEKKAAKEKRIYELSQTGKPSTEIPYQLPLRHLCNLLQINDGDFEKTLACYPDLPASQKSRAMIRAKCAWAWITQFAPEDFRFTLRKAADDKPVFSAEEKALLSSVKDSVIGALDTMDEKQTGEKLYDIAKTANFEPKALFEVMYRLLVSKNQGPRLASFLKTIGKDRCLGIFGFAGI